ncbi:MAG TPA: hypothetical protein VES64_09485 [Allosphingosinicella sp.]|nr:hypothetical protein [Allosphingosinicella sp.]
MRKLITGLLVVAATFTVPAMAQRQRPPQPQQINDAIISIYRAAPGHQEQLLTWLARQDEISRAAGLPAAQLFVHQNGASWDFLIVAPQTTQEQDDALEAAARRMRAPVGPRAGLELRQHIAEHTDTLVAGPTTAADWLRRIGE